MAVRRLHATFSDGYTAHVQSLACFLAYMSIYWVRRTWRFCCERRKKISTHFLINEAKISSSSHFEACCRATGSAYEISSLPRTISTDFPTKHFTSATRSPTHTASRCTSPRRRPPRGKSALFLARRVDRLRNEAKKRARLHIADFPHLQRA